MFRKPKRFKSVNVFNAKIGRTYTEKYSPRPIAIDPESEISSSAVTDDVNNDGVGSSTTSTSSSSSSSSTSNLDVGLLLDAATASDELNEPEESRYSKEKKKRLTDWKEIQPNLVASFFEGEHPSSLFCRCGSDEPEYRCLDCCEWETLCVGCLEERHRFPHLHKFEAWKDHVFIAHELESPTWRISHSCQWSYTKIITIVDEKGRQHKRSVEFCSCEEESTRLITLHLWPSTVKKPSLAFHFEIMKWINGLFIEGHLSVKAFCEALKARASKHDRPYVTQEVSHIYNALMTECFKEFRSFLYEVEHPFYEDGTSCPACYKSSRKVISLDADFQLVRKKSAGGEWGLPKHSGHFTL